MYKDVFVIDSNSGCCYIQNFGDQKPDYSELLGVADPEHAVCAIGEDCIEYVIVYNPDDEGCYSAMDSEKCPVFCGAIAVTKYKGCEEIGLDSRDAVYLARSLRMTRKWDKEMRRAAIIPVLCNVKVKEENV